MKESSKGLFPILCAFTKLMLLITGEPSRKSMLLLVGLIEIVTTSCLLLAS
jgi:hypothetical protein